MFTLDELIDFIISEPNVNPRDICFRYSVAEFPKEIHDAFDFPGEYMSNIRVDGHTEELSGLEMDSAQIVMPDGDITCKSTINVEHQTYPIKNKIHSLYEYKLFLIRKYALPSNSVVITNMDLKEEKIYCESHDQIFYLRIIVADDDKISKRLLILEDKIENDKELSPVEALYFSYISIFVRKHHAKETLEKLSYLFSKITDMDEDKELFLHKTL